MQVFYTVLAQTNGRRAELRNLGTIALINSQTNEVIREISYPESENPKVLFQGASLVVELPELKRRLIFSKHDGHYIFSQDTKTDTRSDSCSKALEQE